MRSRRSRAGIPKYPGVEVERLFDRQEPVEVELLRREPNRLTGVGVVVDRVVAEYLDRPSRRLREPGRAVDQRRLARPVGAEQPEELPPVGLQGNVLQRFDPVRVTLLEINYVECPLAHAGLTVVNGALRAQRWEGIPPAGTRVTVRRTRNLAVGARVDDAAQYGPDLEAVAARATR